jgi:hypothetical protein
MVIRVFAVSRLPAGISPKQAAAFLLSALLAVYD